MRTEISIGVALIFGTACFLQGDDSETESLEQTQQRERLDRQALQLAAADDDRATTRRGPESDFLAWLVERVPIPPAEIEQRATVAHEKMLTEFASVAVPPVVSDVMEQLYKSLSDEFLPADKGYTITVLDSESIETTSPGGRFVEIGDRYLASLTEDSATAPDRVAFAIAHEMGHIVMGHCQRRHQLLWVTENLADRIARIDLKAAKTALDELIDRAGSRVEFLMTAEEDYEADLFAIHLCRNAGFKLENSLDVVRDQVRRAPDVVDDHSSSDRALRRLRQLRWEIDGIVTGDEFGLFRFHSDTEELTKLVDGSLVDVDDAVVFVHGMESSLETFGPMMRAFASESPRETRPELLGFQYPGNGSLARMSRFLQNELARTGAKTPQFDFVCHSAGGLVVRTATEVHAIPFRKAVFIATPHGGSDLRRLRPLLEARILTDAKSSYGRSMRSAITAGRGQILNDLLPYSLFFSRLNGPDRVRPLEQYAVIRGRVLGGPESLLIRPALQIAHRKLSRKLGKTDRVRDSLIRQVGTEWVDMLEPPDELTDGDLAVTLASAGLDGVHNTETFRLNHLQLPRDQRSFRAVARFLNEPNN